MNAVVAPLSLYDQRPSVADPQNALFARRERLMNVAALWSC
jgi:hypothetical protein